MARSAFLARPALIGVLVAALTLGACGRRSALDAPPSAALNGPQLAAPQPEPQADPAFGQQFSDPSFIMARRPAQPRGQTAPPARPNFPLDWLLN